MFVPTVTEEAELSTIAPLLPPSDPAKAFDTLKTNLSDYIWPTDASRKVTSSFAEYRSTHFHGGIDISTNGQVGHNVFAVRDGYVSRISIAPNGYGKMLYVTHSDGYVTTYSHLQTFNDVINSAAREEQIRRGTYAIDLIIYSKRLPVKQGEVIAYSGNTGFGPPHLHFELRDENLNPVNPLLLDNFSFKDDIPPSIRRLMVSPLTPFSTVNGSNQPKFFSRFPRRASVMVKQPISIQGKIGFGAEALDYSDGTWSKAGIHRMEFYIDNSLTFAMQLNRVPSIETKLIHLHYDYPTILRGFGKFQKLYRDIGNSLPFYEKRPEGAGIIDTDSLSEGEHIYKIICKDIHGNKTELSGKIIVNRKPVLSLGQIGEDEITVGGRDLSSINKFFVYGKKLNESAWTQHTLPKGRYDIVNEGVKIPVDLKRYDLIKIIAETSTGSHSNPLFHVSKKPQYNGQEVSMKTDIRNDFVRVSVSTNGIFTSRPVCSLIEGSSSKTFELEAADVNNYTGIIIPSDSYTGQSSILITTEVNGRSKSARESIELYSIPTNRSGRFSYDDGRLQISYDSGAVFKPLHMRIKKSGEISSGYELIPEDILLNQGITVTIPVATSFDKQHYGLFFRSDKGWVFQTAEPDSTGKFFSTQLTRTLGEVALLHDDSPPSIGRLRVFPRGGKPNIGFSYYDNLSGIDPDEIKMYIDDVLVIPEIDGEHHRVWYQADKRLERGRHTLNVIMKDRMKNETKATRLFSIK